MAITNNSSEPIIRPILALEREDVGNLDAVLRDYYLSQIKRLDKRKDRKLARTLLQDHLILPKSRQRTSKDAAYIQEVLGMEPGLLAQLEESRLIRRIQFGGGKPIYEISHDTLVEPILAEKRDQLAIAAFIKKTWKYAALFLLSWFLFGMIFQDAFEVLPDLFRTPKTVDLNLDKQTIGFDNSNRTVFLNLPPFMPDQEIKPTDTIRIKLPLEAVNLSLFRSGSSETTRSNTGDTLSILLAKPLDIPGDQNGQIGTIQSFSNLVVPLTAYGIQQDRKIYASLSGTYRIIPKGSLDDSGVVSYDQSLTPTLEITLGDTLVQAGNNLQTIPLNFTLQLSDLLVEEHEKVRLKNVFGDRQLKLTYSVKVRGAPVAPPQVKVEYPAVQGVEVQYSDGTRRFISGEDVTNPNGIKTIHVVAAGETLFSIAKKYGIVDASGNTAVQPIKKLNNLKENTLSVGQPLLIPNL